MATFHVKSRKTGPIVVETIEADHREAAIAQVAATAEEGGSVEVMQVVEGAPEAAPQARKEK